MSRVLRSSTAAVALALAALAAAASPASAETIRGVLQFTDADGTPKPIRNAKVEVWRLPPGAVFWGNALTISTDSQGRLDAPIAFAGVGTKTALRVFATNDAAQVMTQDFLIPFYREPGRPGTEIQRTTATSGDFLDFTFTFPDAWANNHFNIADAIKWARDYAGGRRDPRQSDVINRVDVHFNSVSTYYDPVLHAVRLDPTFAMDDFTVVHEYTHYLEEQIGSFYGIASIHNGCTATAGGVDVRGAGLAWMEGFASYLPQAVQRATGALVRPVGFLGGSFSAAELETPACPPTNLPPTALERPVAGTLFDLLDEANPAESFDELARRDVEIFQIFDHELDLGWTNPTFEQFANAWLARGLDAPQFFQVLSANSMFLTTPQPPELVAYDHAPAANVAVYRHSDAKWYVLGGEIPPFPWGGLVNDIPVPADYDGDGLTDLAIRRNADATWWVRNSTNGTVRTFASGAAGDIPLVADYDGDGEDDFALFRNGTLRIVGDTAAEQRNFTWVNLAGGVPVVGDFVGDSKPDLAVYEPSTGTFWITSLVGTGGWSFPVVGRGFTADVPVPGDYTFGGKQELAVYEPSSGEFRVLPFLGGTVVATWWGVAGERPVPHDYDGDGDLDLATWNPSDGWWFIRRNDGSLRTQQWGIAGDVAVPAR